MVAAGAPGPRADRRLGWERWQMRRLDRGGIAALSGGHGGGGLRLRRRAGAAAVPGRAVRSELHADRAADALSDRLVVARAAALRVLLSDSRGAMWLLPGGRSRRRRGIASRGRGAELRARARRSVRRGPRHRRLSPGGSEVRGVRERPPARERHVPLQRRREHRLRARPDHHHADRAVARAQRDAGRRAARARRRGGDHSRAPVPARPATGRRVARGCAGEDRPRAMASADRRDPAAHHDLVRAHHLRAAVGRLARPFQGRREPAPLADARGRGRRRARARAGRRPDRPASHAARDDGAAAAAGARPSCTSAASPARSPSCSSAPAWWGHSASSWC